MKKIFLLIIPLTGLYSCNKEISNQVANPAEVDVYVAGRMGDKEVYWKNGVPFELNISSPGLSDPHVNSIAVSGNDVYVAGYATVTTWTGQFDGGVLWKNGNEVQLSVLEPKGELNSLAFSNNDVYTVQLRGVDGRTPQYLKNGNPVSLTIGDFKEAFAHSITVSGIDVYVAGRGIDVNNNKVAIYWKNENIIKLSDGSMKGSAMSIAVSGPDVYVAGFKYTDPPIYFNGNGETISTAIFWKNGTPVNLTDGSTYTRWYAIEPSIAFLGTDVYAAVNDVNGQPGLDLGKIWKNGNLVSLTSNSNVFGVSIAISGTDVYVAGTEYDGVHYIAKYWKNGIPVTLADNSYTEAIFLKPR